MELLTLIDQQVFYFINHLPHTASVDTFMMLVSGIGTGGIIWFTLGFMLFWREEKRDHWFLLQCFFIGVLGFLLSEIMLKNFFSRIRPDTLASTIVVGTAPESYSFPSSHTVFAVACAILLSIKEPLYKWVFIILAVVIALSRMYLGYHYPSDVLGGIVVGIMLYGISYYLTILSKHILLDTKKKKRS